MPLRDDLLHLIEHDNALAQDLLRGLSEALPQSFEAWRLRGAAHERRFEFDAAMACYERAQELEPQNADLLQSMALIRLNQGDPAQALAAYDALIAASPAAFAYNMRALLLHRLGRLPEAIRTYEQVLSGSQPGSHAIFPALDGLARAQMDAGRLLAASATQAQLLNRFAATPGLVSTAVIGADITADFHEWAPLTDKGRLARFLTARAAADPEGARVPESFELPAERQALLDFAARPDAPGLYIIKPVRSSGGQGIRVVADVADAADLQDVVVQRYIDRPFLIDGHKGHVRIYGLITSAAPLRAYVFCEGIVRIAPELYDASPEHAADVARHVTNTALHLGHPGVSVASDPGLEDVGTVRTLSALLARLDAAGLSGAATLDSIADLVGWFVRQLKADGLFERQAASAPANAFAPKLFGLDVLVDERGAPWLIELQRSPAVRGAPLVERVNTELFATAFRMTRGPLVEDGMAPERIAAALADPTAREALTLEREARHMGRFRRLDLM